LDEGGAVAEVDRDGTHRRKIDDDAVVAYRRAGNAVPSTSYGDLEVAVSGEAHRGGHIRGAAAAVISRDRRSTMPFQTARATS